MINNTLRLLAALFFLQTTSAQVDSLKTIKIIANPAISLENSDFKQSFSVTSRTFDYARDAKQQLSLDEYLQNIPGLFVLNRNNFSQDLRIAIRGFGARSSFGIRGIKIVVDGIPETTPDGQGQIDNLTLSIIDKLQVLRGPASLLYGNASGGTINIQTIQDVDSTFIQAGATVGNYNMLKYDLIAGISHSKGSTILSAARTTTDGYREHSAFESNQFNMRSNFHLDATSNLSFQLNYTDSPQALDAGGLTLNEVTANRRQARSRNIQFDSQEQVRQLKTGLAYKKQWNALGFNTYAFYNYRDFDNKLPFESGGQVELYRNYYGHGSYITYDTKTQLLENTLQVGYAFAWQADQRQRFDNIEGVRGGSDFNQLESFNSYGFYAIDNLQWDRWNFQGGLRYDINQLKAEDRTIAANSSDRNLNSFSGSLGINYELKEGRFFYGNVSTSFETPALTELSANPDGGTGFNPDLQPQQAVNYELGYKSLSKKLMWNGALFFIDTRDDLVPFELAPFPDRTFYRNAGSTHRYGLELFADYRLAPQVSIQGSYTYSDFTYQNFNNNGTILDGNQLPGIPEHLATIGLTYRANNGLFVQWNTNYRGELFANDANTASIESALISDLNLSYPIKWDNALITLNGGINNLFDVDYFDNVRLNAFGNRFYEPAPGINFFAGVRVRI